MPIDSLALKATRGFVRACAFSVLALLMATPGLFAAEVQSNTNAREYLVELSRLGARNPFLTDSSDVYLEQQSLSRFFTDAIYRRLEGNAYFGYRYDEGFVFEGNEVRIDLLKELPETAGFADAYRMALEQAFSALGIRVSAAAVCEMGICLVGIERRETERTLPGVMIEAYLRNSHLKKSFFIRQGSGSPRGIVSAIRLSAGMLAGELEARRKRP